MVFDTRAKILLSALREYSSVHHLTETQHQPPQSRLDLHAARFHFALELQNTRPYKFLWALYSFVVRLGQNTFQNVFQMQLQ